MEFKASQKELLGGLQRVSSLIQSRTALPILGSILFDLKGNELKLSATDLEISMETLVTVTGLKDGKLVLPCRRMLEIIKELPDVPFTLNSGDGLRMEIVGDRGNYKISGEKAEEFPAIPKGTGKIKVELPAQRIKRIIEKTVFAVSVEELRIALTGVLFQFRENELAAVSTDGHRMVKILDQGLDFSGEPLDVIVPTKALHMVARNVEEGSVKVLIDENHIVFKLDHTVIYSRLIEGKFPDYESVVPRNNDKRMRVGCSDLLNSVKRVAIFSNAATHQIKFEIADNKLKIFTEDPDVGSEANEELGVDYQGEPLTIGYNAIYVMDILSHLDPDDVVFELGSSTGAGIVRPVTQAEKEDLMMLVMPVKLTE